MLQSIRCHIIHNSEKTNFGKMSTCLAAIGRLGRLSSAVCIDIASEPSERIIVIGCDVGVTFMRWLASERAMKWPVVPVSALMMQCALNC